MADVKITDKFVKSRQSLLDLGNQLKCKSCNKLAYNPHVLGKCEHVFCLPCTDIHSGKPCPVCGTTSSLEDCKADTVLGNLIEAYIPISKYLNIDSLQNEEMDKANSSTLSNPNQPSINSSIIKSIARSKETECTKSPLLRNCKMKVDLNESLLDTSINGTSSMSKINKRNQKGETPLQVACVKQDLEQVKELLMLGANPNTQDNAGWTPLHEVVGCGNENIIKLLLANGANPNIPGGQNDTPLHDAVACNRPAIVRLLVSHGADVNARNSRGLTPKDMCLSGSEEMIKALEVAKTTPVTPCQPDRLRISTQGIQLYVLNPEKKSQPKLNKTARMLGVKLTQTYSSQVTHVIVRLEDSSTVIKANPHFYSAVLQGQFIVDFKWIEESEKSERLLDLSPYEIDGTLAKAPAEGTSTRLNAANQLPGLFNNCFFYLHGVFSSPSKADITQWIKHGGGTVLTRSPNPENISTSEKVPYHASPSGPLAKCSHFILYDNRAKTQPSLKYNMSHVKTLSIDWLIACIENFALIDPF